MTLYELIQKHHWLSIETELIRLYPDEEAQIDAYREVFNQLKEMTPDPFCDIVIRLTEVRDEDTEYVDVDGFHADGRVDPLSGNDGLALEFTPWDQWLGMQVDESAFREFTELEIVAHCLNEMTFVSFDPNEIKDQWKELTKMSEGYKQMTSEEKEKNTRSLEDFLGEIDFEDEG